MKHNLWLHFFCAAMIFAATVAFAQKELAKLSAVPAPAVAAQSALATGTSRRVPSDDHIRALRIDLMSARGLKKSASGSAGRTLTRDSGKVPSPASIAPLAIETPAAGASSPSESGSGLPLWTYRVRSSRDGNRYPGAMVGRNPFKNPGPSNIPTQVIPLIIKTKNVAVSLDPKTGIITTKSGKTAFNPARADDLCLSPPNDVPIKLVSGSPIFSPASFSFGGTFVGNTQYNDAFQRANFWNVLGEDRDNYHVRLKPVQFLDPIVVDVPSVYGLAITDPLFFGPPAFCAPFGIVDIGWFDNYISSALIPALASKGVSPASFPIFLVYNVVWGEPVTNLSSCCALGYHSITGFPMLTQTYSPAEFDTTGVFGYVLDTEILSHEVDEWMDDPLTVNPTPLWGNTGQVQGGCQGNLEVGDPLTGTDSPSVTMPNGYTYHLQELAFFSWFFGAPSIGVNGWFSDNGTFTTDAGAPCF